LSERRYYDEYDEATTERCERALITLIGDLGPWGNRIYLAGGLAPRYLVGRLPEDARAHVGTTDVDLVIGLALGDEMPETYRTCRRISRSQDSIKANRASSGPARSTA
jgi:hypothetical protein